MKQSRFPCNASQQIPNTKPLSIRGHESTKRDRTVLAAAKRNANGRPSAGQPETAAAAVHRCDARSRGRRTTRILYRRASRKDSWDEALYRKPVIHESVLHRANAAQIRVWRQGKPAVVAGEDYKPWITAGDSRDSTLERWPIIDRGEGVTARISVEDLVKTQEQKWQDCLDIQRQNLPWL